MTEKEKNDIILKLRRRVTDRMNKDDSFLKWILLEIIRKDKIPYNDLVESKYELVQKVLI